MPNTIVKTTDLQIGYSGKKNSTTILSDINVTLRRGGLTALLGINGSGKSTLLRTLAGIQPLLGGEVYIDKTTITQHTPADLAQKISIVLTEKVPESNLTVFDLLRIGRIPYMNWKGTLRDEDYFWIEKAIELTHCKSLADKKIDTLSDGQLQRVNIARAIAQNTPIIILDEPSSHLDLHHKVDLYLLLKELATNEDKAILFSSHDMELCLEITNESIVIQNDKCTQNNNDILIEQGTFDHFFSSKNLAFDRLQKRFILK